MIWAPTDVPIVENCPFWTGFRRPFPVGIDTSLRRGPLLLSLAALLWAASARAETSATTPEQGYEGGEVQHPRLLGMAGAQTALGTSTNALFSNPANLVLARVYHFEGLAALGPEARRQSYGGAIVDSSTNRLGGGLGGVWSMMDPDGIRRTWTDLRVALAYPLGDMLAIGLTGRYIRVSQAVSRGPLGASFASDGTRGDPIFARFTFDAGATLSPTEGLRIGLVGKNLTYPENGFAPTQLSLGVGYAAKVFSVEADGLVDFNTFGRPRARGMIGGEVLIADRFPVRLGYRYDDGLRAHAITGGLGYVDRRWSFEIGARRDVAAAHPATTVGAGIRYFYDGQSAADEPDPAGM